jgi:flavin-binding protein dodecin
MTVAKIIEIISESTISFDDAIKQGIARASETVSDVAAAWVKDQSVSVSGGKVTSYHVTLKVTFVIKAAGKSKGKGK